MEESEKRRHKRVRAQGMAAYLWIDGKMTSAILENLSAGGVFFRMPKPAPPGTPVKMRLVQPGLKKAVELSGNVVNYVSPSIAMARGIPPGLGVQFDSVPPEQEDVFTRLLNHLGLPPLEPQQLEPMQLEPLAVEPVAAEPTPASGTQAGPVLPGAPVAARVDPVPVAQGVPLKPVEPEPAPYDLPLTPVEPASAPPAAPQEAASGSASFVDYKVHDAALKMGAKPAKPAPSPKPVVAPAPVPSSVNPEPISVEVQVPRRKKRAAVSDVERLMEHVHQLMSQLTEANEIVRQRDQDIAALKLELERARLEMYQVKRRLASFEGG